MQLLHSMACSCLCYICLHDSITQLVRLHIRTLHKLAEVWRMKKRVVTADYNCISNNTECHWFCSNDSLYKISSESIKNTFKSQWTTMLLQWTFSDMLLNVKVRLQLASLLQSFVFNSSEVLVTLYLTMSQGKKQR